MERLADLGPLYTETNLDHFPVEPLNTVSNLLFLFVAIYWYIKRPKVADSSFKAFLTLSLPFLLIGYIGGTLYHATRAHVVWMVMDVVPIYFIAMLTAIYHWRLIKVSSLMILICFLIFLVLPLSLLWTVFETSQHSFTLSYFFLTLPVLFPIFIDQYRLRFRLFGDFLIPLVTLSVALSFRSLDATDLVSRHFTGGTHWLWHTFGAITCHLLLAYMHRRSMQQL